MKKAFLKSYKLLVVCIFASILCLGCKPFRSSYNVGRDLGWFPVQFGLYSANINAYTNNLISTIEQLESVDINVVNLDWVAISEWLDDGKIDAAFSTLVPRTESKNKYDFSDPFLLTGPVIVFREKDTYSEEDSLQGKLVGVYQFDSSVSIAQDFAKIFIKLYQHIPSALEGLYMEEYDALLVPAIEAYALVDSLYKGKLKVVSQPLSAEGLRMVVLKGQNKSLLKNFNKGMKSAESSGKIKTLKQRYKLDSPL